MNKTKEQQVQQYAKNKSIALRKAWYLYRYGGMMTYKEIRQLAEEFIEAFDRLTRRWSAEGTIPEISNLK